MYHCTNVQLIELRLASAVASLIRLVACACSMLLVSELIAKVPVVAAIVLQILLYR